MFELSAWSLRVLAMACMLCDHLWATIIPGNDWLTWVGRLAYPVFAFLLAEGFRHTGNFKKYWGRMALFAVLSEVPFDLMGYAMPLFPFHQNVLWTFCIALLTMKGLEKLKAKSRPWLAVPLMAGLVLIGYLAGLLFMVDYGGWGVGMVLVFYFLPGTNWLQKLGQLVCLYLINWEFMGSQMVLLGNFEFPVQGLALLALPFIWLYKGSQGPRNPITKWVGYWFYPVHALILGLLYLYL